MKELITRFRVSAACNPLGDADSMLERIAELTGFDDASHLSRVFVRQRGTRRGEYPDSFSLRSPILPVAG